MENSSPVKIKNLFQSALWGEVKSHSSTTRLFEIGGESILILKKKFPFIGRKFGYIPRGFSDEVLSSEFLAEFNDIFMKSDYDFILLDPKLETERSRELLMANHWVEIGEPIQQRHTNIIELKSIDENFGILESSTRNKIRRPEKDGTETEILASGDEAIERFIKIIKTVSDEAGFVSFSADYYRKLWNILANVNAYIVIIKKDGVGLGGYLVVHDSHTGYELYGGVLKIAREVRGVGYALKWASIEEAIRRGLKYYDQWGVAKFDANGEYDANDKFINISKFKAEFGGKNTEYLPQFAIIKKKLPFNLYRIAKKANELLVKIRS